MKHLITLVAFALASASAWADTSVIEGKVSKVVAKKSEIYVMDKDGKKHEYYFNKDTKILHGGEAVSFDHLAEGQSVRVTAEKKGKRLDPQKVEILP